MEVTCGSFVIDKTNKILLCRATGTMFDWTVPKGLMEKDELPHMAAKRELLEETGIDISKYQYKMTEMGISPYPHKKKVIVGFLFEVDDIIEQSLFCSSYFTDSITQMRLPEVDAYSWCPIDEIVGVMRSEQYELLKHYLK